MNKELEFNRRVTPPKSVIGVETGVVGSKIRERGRSIGGFLGPRVQTAPGRGYGDRVRGCQTLSTGHYPKSREEVQASTLTAFGQACELVQREARKKVGEGDKYKIALCAVADFFLHDQNGDPWGNLMLRGALTDAVTTSTDPYGDSTKSRTNALAPQMLPLEQQDEQIIQRFLRALSSLPGTHEAEHIEQAVREIFSLTTVLAQTTDGVSSFKNGEVPLVTLLAGETGENDAEILEITQETHELLTEMFRECEMGVPDRYKPLLAKAFSTELAEGKKALLKDGDKLLFPALEYLNRFFQVIEEEREKIFTFLYGEQQTPTRGDEQDSEYQALTSLRQSDNSLNQFFTHVRDRLFDLLERQQKTGLINEDFATAIREASKEALNRVLRQFNEGMCENLAAKRASRAQRLPGVTLQRATD